MPHPLDQTGVEALFRSQTRAVPPRVGVTDAAARAAIARRLRDGAARPRWCDPRQLAVANDIRCLDRSLDRCCAAAADPGRIVWAHAPDPRENGLRVYHALAHCALAREGLDAHTEADAWLLTGELVCPGSVLAARPPVDDLVRVQRFAPRWVLSLLLETHTILDGPPGPNVVAFRRRAG